MRKMTYGQLDGVIKNDNTNINAMIRGFINESANASVVAIYDDSLVLLDTVNEEFYVCGYHYNPDQLSVILENFEKIELSEDTGIDFKTAVKDYLIYEEQDSTDLLSAYMRTLNKEKTAVKSVVAEAVADKDYSNAADFDELSFINEEFDELRAMPFFESYQERLITHPLSNVLVLDWETPVAFTLLETCEPKKYINSNSKAKAKAVLASKNFKKKLCGACREFVEDVEEGADALLELFSENLSLFSLSGTELKEGVSRAIMLDPEINSEYRKIAEAVVHLVGNDEAFQYLKESIDIDDSGDDEQKTETDKSAENQGEQNSDEKKTDDEKKDEENDKPVELTAEDKEKLVSALKTVVEKSTDEKIKQMAQELIDKFDNDDEGTKPDEVKEAVRFLSI